MKKIYERIQTKQSTVALLISAMLFILTIVLNPKSLNVNTLGSVLALTSILALASAGQTLVVLSGGIDMSTGDTMSVAAILTVSIMHGSFSDTGNFILALIVSLLVGMAIGLFNGIGVAVAGLPPMVVTLYIANVVDKLQYVFTNGTPLHTSVPNWYKGAITERFFSVLPTVFLVAILLYLLMQKLLNRTYFARQLYLTGNNSRAAWLTGVRTTRLKVVNYVVAGLLNGLAGFIGAGNTGSVVCGTFSGMTMSSIVAVVVGGTLLAGGKGSYQATITGALLLTVLSNGLAVLQVSDAMRNLIMGIVLILLLSLYNREKAVKQ